MRKITSVKYSATAFNMSMLLLRLGVGLALLCWHGIPKMMQFGALQHKFADLFGFGQKISLLLVIFAEVFCSIFLILGLFTRLAAVPILILLLVALFMIHIPHGGLKEGELALVYLLPAITLLLCGAGRISVDGMMGK